MGGPFSTLFPVTNSFASGPDIVAADASRVAARFLATDDGFVWMAVAPDNVVGQLTIGDIKSGNPSLLAPCVATALPVVRRTAQTVTLDGCTLSLNTSYSLVAYLDTSTTATGGQVLSTSFRTATNAFSVDPAVTPRTGEYSVSYDGFLLTLTPAVTGRMWAIVATVAVDAATAVAGSSLTVPARPTSCTVGAQPIFAGTVASTSLRGCELIVGRTYVVTVYIDDASVRSRVCGAVCLRSRSVACPRRPRI